MRHKKKPLSKASLGSRGGRCITPGSGGSKDSDSDSEIAVTMFTHRICKGVMGRVSPSKMPTMIAPACPRLVGRM